MHKTKMIQNRQKRHTFLYVVHCLFSPSRFFIKDKLICIYCITDTILFDMYQFVYLKT